MRKKTDYTLKAHDLVWAWISLVFAAFSLAWPKTGRVSLGPIGMSRGYLMALAFLCIAALSLLFPLIELRFVGASESLGKSSGRQRLFIFVRTYYPQAFFSLFFTEAILLSAQAFGGVTHDAFFEAADLALFGCQPAREFSRSLGSPPWINELMFGAYFGYFAFMVVAIWIPFFKGNRAEGERQVFVVTSIMGLVCAWYVFFRVEGPKYWLPDLRSAWYDGVQGGLFVGLFKLSLAKATLSGAAFPSTHVILTTTTLALAWRNDRRYFAVYLPVAVLILLSTVYIYAHWATDVLGGALAAALLAPLAYRAYGRADSLAARLSPLGLGRARRLY